MSVITLAKHSCPGLSGAWPALFVCRQAVSPAFNFRDIFCLYYNCLIYVLCWAVEQIGKARLLFVSGTRDRVWKSGEAG